MAVYFLVLFVNALNVWTFYYVKHNFCMPRLAWKVLKTVIRFQVTIKSRVYDRCVISFNETTLKCL